MKPPEYLERSFKREREARLQAEALLEQKTRESYILNAELQAQYDHSLKNLKKVQLLLSIIQVSYKDLSVEEKLQFFINSFCEFSGWPVGHIYFFNKEKNNLYPSTIWYLKNDDFNEFKEVTQKTFLKKGEGLPGRVLESQKTAWIKDVTQDTNFPRIEAAKNCNLGSAFAVPIIIQNKIIAISEFFFPSITEKDTYLLQICETGALQLALTIDMQLKNDLYEEKLKFEATHDKITNLPNRLLLIDRIKQSIANAKRFNQKVAIIFIDLDRFKYVNDILGHATGDQLLKMIANRIESSIRRSDTIARIGGDEFVLIMPSLKNVLATVPFMNKILKLIASPFILEEREFNISASMGCSIFPDDGETPEILLKNADAAMYEAKRSGKNKFEFFTKNIQINIKNRVNLENDLRQAIEKKEFTLYYQPILSLSEKKITKVEALIRWQHPKKGLILPDQFIPLAEELDYVIPIGEEVLRMACIQNKRWQVDEVSWIKISVNISTRQLSNTSTFIPLVLEILKSNQLNPYCLEFEMTESFIIENPKELIKILHELKNIGISLTIDDFGTGYSSLSYLKQFPIDYLKIDRSFVHAYPDELNASAMLKSIISLGHSLNLKLIAEGVETKEQFDFLKENGCDEIQGYFLSKPLPSEEITKLLLDKNFYEELLKKP